jgi:hypothetical protein
VGVELTYGRAQKAFGFVPAFDPEDGVTVLEPAAPGPGNWVGCPSVLYDPARESVLLTYRRRRPRGEPDDRGYRCAVAESSDGVHFRDVWTIDRSEVGSTSLERFNLHRDPDGRYLLYLSYEHPEDGRWRIEVIEDTRPDGFDPARRATVLTPAATGTAAVKDPYVVRAGPAYLMLVSTFLTDAGPAPTYLATSLDGLSFRWEGELLGVGTGWDRYQARLSSVLATDAGFVGFYDGAAGPEEDTEERLGVAVSADLRRWERLTVDAPWAVSPYATGSLRYVDALPLEGEWWLYYEVARADGSHELRLNRVPGG